MNSTLSACEWSVVGPLLTRGDHNQDAKLLAAQACLFRFNVRLSYVYRTFGWNCLPASFGISGKTANRCFIQWVQSGDWYRFWDALLECRFGVAAPEPHQEPSLTVKTPAEPMLAELARAYRFFNDRYFGGELPHNIILTVEGQKRMRFNGYYSTQVWKTSEGNCHHIALMQSSLTSVDDAMATLLHEIAHLRNFSLGLEDTNPKTQYHTQDFRDVAELLGLECGKRCTRWGYHQTKLGTRAKESIARLCPRGHVFAIQRELHGISAHV